MLSRHVPPPGPRPSDYLIAGFVAGGFFVLLLALTEILR